SSATLPVEIDTILPSADAGADQSVFEGDLVNLLASSTDGASTNIRTYSWTQVSGPTVVLSTNGAAARFRPADNGIFEFSLTVTDVAGNTGSDSIIVTANNADPALSNVVISAPVINENGIVTITGTISDAGSDSFTLTARWDDG